MKRFHFVNKKKMRQRRREHVLLMGHSFIRRLQRDGEDFNDLNLRKSKISWVGHTPSPLGYLPLNLVSDIIKNFHEIMLFQGEVDVVYLFIGTNDLVWFWEETPEEVADWVYALARKLFNLYGVKRVVFMECLMRFGNRSFGRAKYALRSANIRSLYQVEEWFAARMHAFNNRLKYWARSDSRCYFEAMKGFKRDTQDWLIDGLHLDWKGRDKLRALLRRSIIVQSYKARR